MPKPKNDVIGYDNAASMQIFEEGGPIEHTEHHAVLRDIAKLITTRNANGKRSDKFCKLCPAARVLRMKCPHTKVWELAK